ncbi:MAG TPA: hypothetical protein VK054_12200, partial [Beutenbergiaceae bacterium]|nr:hypothetical protein [Beutenbergiaceae bacterium]
MVSDSSAVRRLAARLLQVERGLRNVSTVPQLGRSSLDDEALTLRDGDGNVMGRVGRQEDGTYGSTTLDGPTPVAPVAPSASGGPGSLTVEWDGKFAGDAAAPLDFHVVEIYVATEPFSDTADARLLGHFSNEAGGEITVARPKGEQHVALVTKARSGKRSELSPLVSAVVESVVDQETVDELNDALENMPSITWLNRAPEPADGEGKPVGAVWRELNNAGEIVGEFEWDGAAWVARPISGDAVTSLEVGKLTAAFSQLDEVVANRIFADIFAATQVTAANIDTETLGADAGFIGVLNSAEIVGAIIKTAATGMRVELDSPNGIRIYNTDNEAVLSADSNGDLVLGGDISLSGQVTTGSEATYAQLSEGGLSLTSDDPIIERSWPTYATPRGIAVSGDYVYVSSKNPDTIDVYDLNGMRVGGWEAEENPTHIGSDGQYVVTARNVSNTICVYDTSGTLERTITTAADIRGPLAISQGLIFAASSTLNNIEVRRASTGALVRNIATSRRVSLLAADDVHLVTLGSGVFDLYTHTGTFVRQIPISIPSNPIVQFVATDGEIIYVTTAPAIVATERTLWMFSKT